MGAIGTRGRPASVHIVEVGGRSGVFQHTVAVAELLVSVGTDVLIHTARDHEPLATGQQFCTCFTWLRSARRARSLRIAVAFLFRTLPHLTLHSRRVVWVQGTFKPFLTLVLLLGLRLTGQTTVFSPHNLFSRTAGRIDTWCITRSVRTAEHVVVYNRTDYESLRDRRDRVWLMPLLQLTPPVPAATLRRWRMRLTGGAATVCAIGQIREDKNIPLLLEAAARTGVRVVVVGPDAGGLAAARQRAEEVNANAVFFPGYHALEDLAAVLQLTGVVICPYRVASQSGVARLAASYGAVVVATDVGGLGEQADVVIDDLTPSAVSAAIQTALSRRRPPLNASVPGWSESEKRLFQGLLQALR